MRALRLQMGGAAPPPTPPLFNFPRATPPPNPPPLLFCTVFFTRAGLLQKNPFQTHFLLGQACFKRIPCKPMTRALCWQMGGAAPPPTPPLFYFPRAGLLQTNPFQTHDAGIVLANGGGCAPPNPPACIFYSGKPASNESLPNP